ncbi:hypothetical protein BH11MYX3_BH11MYX3_39970 [soil metagenome]
MLRASFLTLTLFATATAASAATPEELTTQLQRALNAASTGHCDDALAITREIATADQQFYAEHVPTQPAIAACVRDRLAHPRLAPTSNTQEKATKADADADGGVGLPLVLAGAAGTASWLAAGLLANKLAHGSSNAGGDDEGGPSGEFLIASSLGNIVASSAVVYLARGDSRHESSLAATVTGSVVCGALGTLVGYPMIFESSPWLGLGIVVLSPAIGATLGYQMAKSSKKRVPVEIIPTVGNGGFGAIVGGSF